MRKPAPVSLSVSLGSLTVAEGAGAVTVTAAFDNPVRSATEVTFSAAGVSATAGTDFTVPPSFTVVVAEGATSGESSLTIVDDGYDEDDETFTLAATGGGFTADAVTVTISDDDTAGVSVRDSAVSVDEGATAAYSVVLDARPTATVTVTPASSADAKATVEPAALTFTTGNWSTAQSFTVTGVAEGAATITHTVTSGDSDYANMSVADVEVTVEKPDPTKLTLSVDAQTPSESVGRVTVTATLDWPAKTGGVEVTLAAGNGSTAGSGDYTLPAAFTILEGQREATAQLSITDDDIDDDDETIALTATATAAATAAGLSVSGTTITITDNDAAAVALSAATLALVQGDKKTYTAKLGSEPAASVTVTPTVAAAGESDPAVSVSGALTFTTSNWSVAQTFTVSGIGAGTATINHSASGDSNYGSSLSVGSVTATVTALPTKLTLTTDATNNTIQEDGTTVTVTATLDRPAGSSGVTVLLSAAATSTAASAEYTLPQAFTIVEGQTSASAPVGIADDDVDEDDETLVLTTTADGITVAAVTLTIADDDTAGVVLSRTDLDVDNGADAVYTVALSSQPTADVVVKIVSGTPANATVSPSALTFDAGNWSDPQTVTVNGLKLGTSTITHTVESTDGKYPASLATADVAVEVIKPPPSRLTLTAAQADIELVEADKSVTITATLDQPARTDLAVTLTAADATTAAHPSDYRRLPTFTIPQGETTQTATVQFRHDNVDEQDEKLELTATVAGLTVSGLTFTITDDDTAGLSVGSAGTTQVTITKGAFTTLPLVFSSKPTHEVTVTASSSDPETVALLAGGSVTVQPNEWSSPGVVYLQALAEGTATLSFTVQSADPKYRGTAISDIEVTVGSLPSAVTLTTNATNGTVAEGDSVTVTATLDRPAAEDLSVGLTQAAGSTTDSQDFFLSNVPIKSGSKAGTFTFTVIDDAIDEDTETLVLSANAGDLTVTGVTLTVTDNDTAGVTVSAETLSVGGGAKATYTVVLESQPTADVVITPTSGAVAVARVSGALTFTSRTWATAQTFTVTGVKAGTSTVAHAASGTDPKYTAALSIDSVAVTSTDPPPSQLTLTTDAVIGEGDTVGATPESGTLTVTATLDWPAGPSGVEVDLRALDRSTATAGTDFTLPSAFTIAEGERSATASVTITADSIDEADETIVLRPRNVGGLTVRTVTVKITDDDTVGVTVSRSTLTVPERAEATYTVVLESQPTADVVITPTSSAVAAARVSGALTFTSGNWRQAQTVTVSGVTAGTSTVSHAVSGPGSGYASGAAISSLEVTVEESPPTTLTLATGATNNSVGENARSVTLTATLDQPADTGGLVVTFAAAGTATAGADYTLPAAVTIREGTTSAQATLAITDDDLAEGNETIELSATAGTLPKANLTLTIVDNDTAGIKVSVNRIDSQSLLVQLNDTATYQVRLGSQPTSQVVVTVESGSGETATVNPTTLTFTTADWATRQTVTVSAVGGGTATITHKAASSDGNYDELAGDNMQVTVNTPSPTEIRASVQEKVAEGAGTVTVTLTLDHPAKRDLTVTFVLAGTVDGTSIANNRRSDYLTRPTSTTIPKGAKTIDVSFGLVDDRIAESDAIFSIDPRVSGGGIANRYGDQLTITDDDTAGVVVSESSVSIDPPDTATYTVKLSSQPTASVTVAAESAATATATVSPAAVTFTTGNWGTVQSFTVTGVVAGTTSITHAASGDDGNYGSDLAVSDVDVTVAKPAPTALTVSLASTTVGESARSVTVTAELDQPAKVATTVTFTAADGTAVRGADFEVPATFTTVIAKGATSGTATLTVTDDDIDESDESFTLRANGGGLTAAGVTVTISDDDTAGVTVSESTVAVDEGAKASYTVVLTAEPTEQVVVTATSGTEAAATVSVALTFTSSDWSTAQSFTVTGVDAGTSTVSHAVSGYGTVTAADSVTVTVNTPPPAALTLEASEVSTAEADAETVTLTATLDQPARAATTVTFAFAAASSAGTADFTVPSPFTAVIAKDAKTVDVEITVVDDDVAEGAETAAFTATADSLSAAAVSFTVTDNDTAGVTVSEESVTVDEDATASYTVVLTSEPTEQVVVAATSGTEAAATVSAALTFTSSDWSTAQSFTVTGVKKGTSRVTHAVSGYGTVTTADSVTVTVNTPPPAALTLEASEVSTAEAETETVTLTATLDKPARAATTITFAFAASSAADAADFTVPSPFTATIAKDAKTVDVEVTVVDDDVAEATETAAFTATAGNLSAAAVSFTITDNDTAGVTVSEPTVTVVEYAKATYTVVLDTQPTGDVVVTATSGTEGAATVSAALTFTSSDWSTAQSFTVTGVDAGTSTVTHAVSGYGTVTSADSVTATVLPPLPTTLTLEASEVSTAEADTATVTLTATIDQPARAATTVTFAFAAASSAGTADFTVPSPFTATIAKDTKTVDVDITVVDDDVAEATETAAFTATAGVLSAAAVSFTISDDDTAGVTVSEESVTVDEKATASYTVVLTSEPSEQVVVTATSGTEAAATVSAARTFTSSNWDTAQSFTVTGVKKGTSTVTHAVSGYGTVTTADSVTVTVNTPPPAALTLKASEVSTAETDTETVTLTATLDQPARTATTVTFAFAAASSAGTADFTVPSPFTAVIAKDATSVAATVTVVDDDTAEGTETAAFTASAGSLSAAVSFTITDDDTAGVTVSTETVTVDEQATEKYTVVLTSQPDGDVTVTATSGTPDNARVSAAVTFTSTDWDTAQSFTVTGVKKGTSTVTHAVSGYGTVTTADSVTVTVNTPPPAALTLEVSETTTAEADTETVTLTATLDQPAREATTVTFAFTAASTATAADFTVPDPFTAVIAKDTTSATATVTVVDDDKAEGTETAVFTATTATLTAAAAVSFTITDDDNAGVTVSKETVTVDEDTTASYTVVLTSQPAGQVVVTATSGTEAAATVSAAVTFTTENWGTAQSFTVTGVKKGTSTVTHGVSGYGTVTTAASVEVTVNTPSPAALTLEASETTTAEAATATVTLTATLDQPARTATTVTFAFAAASSAGTADFTVPSPFTATIAKDAKTVEIDIVVVDDDKAEGTETAAFTATAGNLSAAAVSFTVTDNDTAGVTVSPETVTVDEDATASYTVVLTSEPAEQVVVAATSGTEAAATVSAALTFTSSDWSTAQSFTVTGVKKGSSTVTHAVTGYGTVTAASVEVTVNTPPPSTLTVSLLNTTVTESASAVTVTAALDQPARATTTVTFTATDGTANKDADFTVPATFTASIAKGDTSGTATVTITDDKIEEGNETFTVGASTSSLTAAAVTVTITDNDTAGVTVSDSTVTVVEGAKATYTVTLNTQPTADVTVTATSGTPAKASVSEAVTFTTSNWDTAQSFTVTGKDAGTSAITHTVTGYGAVTGAASVAVTVNTPPPSTLTVSLVNSTVAESAGAVTVTAALDQPASAATTVTFTATDGTANKDADFTVPATFTASIAKGDTSGTATVTITDDKIDEGNESFTLAATAGNLSAAGVTVTITDNDTAGVTLSSGTVSVVEDATATYTAVLDTQPTANVTVTPTSGATTKATVSGALTFTTGNWDVPQTFTVTGQDAGTYSITHAATSSDTNYAITTVGTVTATVTAAPPSTLTLTTDASSNTVAEDGGSVTVTATLDKAATTAVSVTLSATGTAASGSDYTLPSSFTIASGATTATATISITDDDIDEDDETIILSASVSGLSVTSVTVTITDDDTAGVTVSETSVTVDIGSTEAYTVKLNSQPTAAVTVTATSAASATARVSPSTRTFTTGNWGTAQSFTVTGAAQGTTSVAHAASGSDSKYGSSLSVADVDVTVNRPAPTSLSVSLENTTVAENAGNVTVTATFNNPVKTATTVTFTASGGTATKGTDYTVPATFTAAAAVGATTVTGTVTITDDKIDEDNETFTVGASTSSLTAAVTVAITDNDTKGVTLSSGTVSMVEGATATYTVVLDTQPTANVTVTATSGTLAKATVSGAVTFTTGNWDTPQTFTVTGQDAGTSSITHAATSSDTNYAITTAGTVNATVTDAPGATLSTGTVSMVEDSTATYTVVLDTRPTESVTVTPTSGTTTKATVSGAVTFTTGNWDIAQTFTVTGVDTGTSEITHAASSSDTDYAITTAGTVTATVTDAPPSTLTLSTNAAGNTVAESAGSVTVTATLDKAATSAVPVSVTLTASGTATASSEYTLPAAFSVAAGQTAATGTVQITDDDIDEDDETIILSTSVNGLSITPVTLTITDNDTAGVTLSTNTVSVFDGATETYTVVLNTQPTAQVAVTPTSGTTTKATVSGAVTFTASNWETPQAFTVTGQDTGTSSITHAATSNDTNYAITTVGTVTATVADAPGVTLSTSTVSMAEDATATYTVVLDTQPTESVTVTATSGTTAKATVSGPVTFTTGNWDTAQTFTVTGVDAGMSTITHTTDSTGDSDYNNLNPDSVTVTVDNPAQTPTLSGPVGGPIDDPSPIDTEEEPDEEDPEEEELEEEPEEETETPNEQHPQAPQSAEQQYKIMPRVAACDSDNGDTSQPFADIDENSYTASDVNCLKELEVTQGTSETTYAPEQPVTRENMASFMSRLFTAVTGDDPPMEEMPFEDVSESSSAANDIASVRALGITEGTSETTYSPEKVVTREQMASFIARLYKSITGEDAPVVETPFSDVSTDSYAADDIGRIYGLGITTGTSDTSYSPEEPVTRAQMASFVARIYRVLTETADDEEPADDAPTDAEPTDGETEPTDGDASTDAEPNDDETPADDDAPTDGDTAPTGQ